MTAAQIEHLRWRFEVLYRAEVDMWLTLPHPQLEGRRPMDCSYVEVVRILDRLESGARPAGGLVGLEIAVSAAL
jgi:hypothetical protein